MYVFNDLMIMLLENILSQKILNNKRMKFNLRNTLIPLRK